MQKGNSGSSQNKKQEDIKQISDGESRVGPDTGGNEYTAAFILYCQKTLDNFRSIYTSDGESEFGTNSGLASSSTSNSRLGSEPGSGKLELAQDYQSQSNDDEEKEALKELSEQFEQMLKAKIEFDDDDDDDDDDDELTNYEKNEELRSLFEQFEQMLKNEHKNDSLLEIENTDDLQSNDYKGKEALEELLEQFEQMLNSETKPSSDDFVLEQYDQSPSNDDEEGLKESLEQPGQAQRKGRKAGASSHAMDGTDAYGEEKSLPNVTEPSTPSHKDGLNDTEIDEMLLGIGKVVKSAKENLGIVEQFWEKSESERAELLAKAGITQEDFEQSITRTGLHLYDVKDYLEGWGDLSMLPETYELLILANDQLSELFEKMYGKKIAEVLDQKNEKASQDGEEDDWELDDDDDDDDDDDNDDDDDDDDDDNDWELDD